MAPTSDTRQKHRLRTCPTILLIDSANDFWVIELSSDIDVRWRDDYCMERHSLCVRAATSSHIAASVYKD
jgi:hypothetical protein